MFTNTDPAKVALKVALAEFKATLIDLAKKTDEFTPYALKYLKKFNNEIAKMDSNYLKSCLTRDEDIGDHLYDVLEEETGAAPKKALTCLETTIRTLKKLSAEDDYNPQYTEVLLADFKEQLINLAKNTNEFSPEALKGLQDFNEDVKDLDSHFLKHHLSCDESFGDDLREALEDEEGNSPKTILKLLNTVVWRILKEYKHESEEVERQMQQERKLQRK